MVAENFRKRKTFLPKFLQIAENAGFFVQREFVTLLQINTHAYLGIRWGMCNFASHYEICAKTNKKIDEQTVGVIRLFLVSLPNKTNNKVS